MKQSKSILSVLDMIMYLCEKEIARIKDKNIFDVFSSDVHMNSYQQQLESLHTDELLELYKSEKNNAVLNKINEARYYLDKLRFFNMPEASADIAHYLSKIKWTDEEAVSLCFGKDPKIVNIDSLNAYVDDIENDPDAKYSAFIKGYLNIMDILQSAPAVKEKNSLSFYLKWFNKHRIYVCEELQSQAVQRGLAEVSDYQWMDEEFIRYLTDDVDNLTGTETSLSDISTEQHDSIISDTHKASMFGVQDNIAHKVLRKTEFHEKQKIQEGDAHIHERSRNSYLRIIAALIDYIEGATIHEKRYPHFGSYLLFFLVE